MIWMASSPEVKMTESRSQSLQRALQTESRWLIIHGPNGAHLQLVDRNALP